MRPDGAQPHPSSERVPRGPGAPYRTRPSPPPAAKSSVSWDGTLDRVGTILLEDGHPVALDARQLLGNFLVELRLHVENPHGDVRRKLVDLAPDERGRHVLGDLRERAEPVRERTLEDDRTETAEATGGPPERLGWARVARIDDAARAVVHDEPCGRHRVADGAGRGDHGIDAGDRHRGPDLAEPERLAEVHEPRDVIQVSVRDDGVFDGELLGHGEGAADAAAVDQDLVVDEEGRRPLPETFAAEGAEHANLHALAILAHTVVR